MERRYSAFTVTSQTGLLNVLKTDCLVSQAWHPSSGIPQPEMVPFTGIWDTGATNSVISQEVVDKCGLVPTGTTLTHNVGGTYQAETYLVSMLLPNNVSYRGVRVTRGQIYGGNMLIGMEIIGTGDFAISNLNGRTVFTFRYPSQTDIDFVEEARR